ncbi:hypothetical protein EDB81DRAFT_922347 [Dactylonectria macrodidyma]|uniref:Uncharacterized protein n=1 Tax=Dactylonectria macrodidyma TaxID=307937 RepID=A0A9P9I9I7_9HYPO|nr:hypothetical protein EDB81DRAFT_922347 [Dactylonectria macrodidyma]
MKFWGLGTTRERPPYSSRAVLDEGDRDYLCKNRVVIVCCSFSLANEADGITSRLLAVLELLRQIGIAEAVEEQDKLIERAHSLVMNIYHDHDSLARRFIKDPNRRQSLIERFNLEITSRSKDRIASLGDIPVGDDC